MNQEYFENRQQALCLKYQPTSASNYRHQAFLQPQTENLSNTLMLAQRIFREYKQNKFQVRKVSVIQPHQQDKEPEQKAENHHHGLQKVSHVQQPQKYQSQTPKFHSQQLLLFEKSSENINNPHQTQDCSFQSQTNITIINLHYTFGECGSISVCSELVCYQWKEWPIDGGYNQYKSRQMASITKIMTCWLALKLTQQFQLDLDNTYFTVPEKAERIGGTTAQLSSGDKLSIRDLLYGLMLPSGNDAAISLQHNFELYKGCDFIQQMNQNAQDIGMELTSYANPHGLYHEANYSSAYDIGILTYHAMQNLQFASIVKTKIYFSEIEDKFGESKEIFWENTNRMLYQGFRGVKTGITKEAGPCVVEYFEDNENSYIIVLLNCRSVDLRWQDAIKLLDWIRQ